MDFNSILLLLIFLFIIIAVIGSVMLMMVDLNKYGKVLIFGTVGATVGCILTSMIGIIYTVVQ
jgi:regulator of protease activity HflC (stomatin/prohibitin superfamily)